jgi:colicin import membrane protein
MLVLSLLLHCGLFSLLFWVPGNNSSGLKMNEAVYEVNIADMPKSGKLSDPAPKKASVRKTSVENRQARRISSASRQKNSVTVSKRTSKRIKPKPEKSQVSSDQLLDRAISKIEKKVDEEKNTDYLDKAIADLDRKMGSSGRAPGNGALAGSLALNIYKMEVETQIKSNWTYPDIQEIEAVVLVKIRRDGTVLGINFIKRSGNKLFDESVLKAIEKSSPLRPLPKEYKENYEEIKIKFNLKDLE